MPGSRVPLHGPRTGGGRDGQAPTPGLSTDSTVTGPAGACGVPSPAWFVPIVPAIAALAVGLYGIARPSLWRDEAYTIEAASRSPGQILSLLRNADAVHGAYYLSMHFVITLFGRSETAIRLPSVAATAVAAGFLAALGVRLAASSGVAWPRVSGLLAGLLYAAAPSVSRYAQEARSYATVSALVVIATYLLVRALEDRRRLWWVVYGAAIALAGLFNLLALLIVPAHAITLLIAAGRSGAAGVNASRADVEGCGRSAPAPPAGEVAAEGAGGPASEQQHVPSSQQHVPSRLGARWWAVAVIAAVVVLIPLLLAAYRERSATAWLGRPGWRQVGFLVTSLAGSGVLIAPVVALLVIALCARIAAARGRPPATADVAVPWLVLPPALLLGISQIQPLYGFRYVVFCLPAVSLPAADGLCWLARFTARSIARLFSGPAVTAAAWLPSALVIIFIAGGSVAPQQAVRTPWSRPDYLRKVSQIVSVHARAGDAVLYVTAHSRVVSQGYPAPFLKLRDIALDATPLATATLNGAEVAPDVLRSRFASVSRVWVVSDNGPVLPVVNDALDIEKLALVRTMRLIGHWYTRNDLLLLYAKR